MRSFRAKQAYKGLFDSVYIPAWHSVISLADALRIYIVKLFNPQMHPYLFMYRNISVQGLIESPGSSYAC